MSCPFCETEMREGALAANGRSLAMAEIVWEPRKKRIRGSKTVLQPGFLGMKTRAAAYCDSCGALVVAPLK